MTDEIATESVPQSGDIPAWYWVAVVCAILFEALGCYIFFLEVRMTAADIAALPIDQQPLLAARPDWYYIAFGVAVWAGLIGTLGLLLRKKQAVPTLLVSLVAVVVQFSSIFIVPAMRAVTPSDALFLPVVILIICYGIFMLGRLAQRRGWLR